MNDYQIHHDVFLSGSKGNIIIMLNTAICSICGSDIIMEGDDIATINKKACIEKTYTLIDFLDEESKRDNPIQEELLKGRRDEDADYGIHISNIKECDDAYTVSLGMYYHDWYASYNENDWLSWAKEMSRLYDCKVVLDRVSRCDGAFDDITTYIFEHKNGVVEQYCIKPIADYSEYHNAFDKLMEIDSVRYLQYKIEDYKERVLAMQDEIECMNAQLEYERHKPKHPKNQEEQNVANETYKMSDSKDLPF